MLKVAYSKIYKHPLPINHRFPMEKYDLIPKKLISENTLSKENFFEPGLIKEEDITLTHSKKYYEKLISQSLSAKEIRPIGFPMSELLIERERKIAQGTIECTKFSFKNGISMNIAGGTHHAFYDKAEGFCMLNDQAIAANYLLNNGLAKKILIIDLDVHQGNGTASIFNDNENVFTLSFHGKKNYPFKKEKSDLDIGLEDKTNDKTYLEILKEVLPKLLKNVKPDFIFYLSGVDILKSDRLGRLGVSIQGCKERDQMVLKLCREEDIAVQCSMGGGYSKDIKLIIEAHANTYRVAKKIY